MGMRAGSNTELETARWSWIGAAAPFGCSRTLDRMDMMPPTPNQSCEPRVNVDDLITDFAATGNTLPRASMQWALDNWDEASLRFVALLEAYAGKADESEQTANALLFAIYLLAEMRDTRAFPGLCRLMRGAA